MSYGTYLSAAGAHAQAQRLEILSHNLANAATPGFKRELAVLQARHSAAIEQGSDWAGTSSLNQVGGGVFLAGTAIDFTRGPVKETGNPTDFAIDGEGFFQVEKDGERFLTRAGNFHFSPEGRLLTEQGFSVLTSAGAPLVVDPQVPWRFLEDGAIEQAGSTFPFGLFQPASPGDLVKAGENLFQPLAPGNPVPADQRRVVNGRLEHAAVQPATEMLELIETSRAYEANVRMIQNHDQAVGALVNRVLRAA